MHSYYTSSVQLISIGYANYIMGNVLGYMKKWAYNNEIDFNAIKN